MIRLTALINLEGSRRQALTHESTARSILLGRDPNADFPIPLRTVSRKHAHISELDGVYLIEDLGSTHGTVVNGSKLASKQKKVLHDGDIVEMTKCTITCAIESGKLVASDAHEHTQAIAARAVEGILGRLGEAQDDGPYLRVLNGPTEGERLLLGGAGKRWTVGRSSDCEFLFNDPNVSRRHALITKDWQGYTVEDLGSRNGIVLNDSPVTQPHRLRDRDELTIGPVRLLFIDPDAELMAALKDVPGFELPDPAPAEAPPPVGTPGDDEEGTEEESDEASPGGDSVAAEGAALGAAWEKDGSGQAADLGELEEIDADLLATADTKTTTEWIVIGAVAVVLAASLILLVALLA